LLLTFQHDDPRPSAQPETAEGLRQQAAACRRLAAASRTRAGRSSLGALADHFDAQASKLDPSSQRI